MNSGESSRPWPVRFDEGAARHSCEESGMACGTTGIESLAKTSQSCSPNQDLNLSDTDHEQQRYLVPQLRNIALALMPPLTTNVCITHKNALFDLVVLQLDMSLHFLQLQPQQPSVHRCASGSSWSTFIEKLQARARRSDASFVDSKRVAFVLSMVFCHGN